VEGRGCKISRGPRKTKGGRIGLEKKEMGSLEKGLVQNQDVTPGTFRGRREKDSMRKREKKGKKKGVVLGKVNRLVMRGSGKPLRESKGPKKRKIQEEANGIGGGQKSGIVTGKVGSYRADGEGAARGVTRARKTQTKPCE